MIRCRKIPSLMLVLFGRALALASDAATSATVNTGAGRPPVAAATATYQGDVGFARTTSQTGAVNAARGVAVGVDQDGFSLSISNAVATRNGAVIGTNFNLDIERDGDVSWSRGAAVANGPLQRSVTVGGSAGSVNGRAASVATASGRSDDYGSNKVRTESHNDSRYLRPAEHAKQVVKVRRER